MGPVKAISNKHQGSLKILSERTLKRYPRIKIQKQEKSTFLRCCYVEPLTLFTHTHALSLKILGKNSKEESTDRNEGQDFSIGQEKKTGCLGGRQRG